MTRTCCALAVASVLITQNTGQQSTTFRASTDLVVVDARVVDGRGAPVLGLTASDFEITVEGHARKIVSAEYQPAGRPLSTPAGAAPADADAASQKSSVLVIADRDNLRTETSRATLDGAAKFIEQLPTSHAVGFMMLPEGGVSFAIGTDRAVIAGTLRRTLGQFNPATAWATDETGIRAALHGVIGRMTALEGRRTVIYLTDRFIRTISTTDLADRAAFSGVVFYVVATDAPVISASSRNNREPPDDQYDGLAGLAVMSGGALLRPIAGSASSFDRLARELSGQYVLSYAADASGDRGIHQIKVSVKRPGVDVRARREFVR